MQGGFEMWGLLCPPAVGWLIKSDVAVHKYVADFIADRAPSDKLDVYGPPLLADVPKIRAGAKVELPRVCLTLKKDANVSGRFVRVSVSDDDLIAVESWMLRSQHGEMFSTYQDTPNRPLWS